MKRLLIVLLLIPAVAFCQLRLPTVISNGMVLQQNSSVRLWGEASAGSLVKITTDWNAKSIETKATKDGRWQITVETSKAGGPYSIIFSSKGETRVIDDILLGEVWICSGQSNMSMPVRGFESQPIDGSLHEILDSQNYPSIRMYTAQRTIAQNPSSDVKGKWDRASIGTTGEMSAVGYFFAKHLCNALKVPVGVINISWGGSNAQAWMDRDLLGTFPEIDLNTIDFNSKSPHRIPTALFNGMFAPISRYTVKGIVWYQGENNIVDHKLYERLLPAMVKLWRDEIGLGEIPFYYVQIAPHNYSGADKTESALLREVQSRCQHTIPNSTMVTTGDLGHATMIHSPAKKPIGMRLAITALARDYGYTTLPYTQPKVRTKQILDNKVIISFDNANGGLRLVPNDITGFEIAGTDGKFYPAQARVHSKIKSQIELHAAQVSAPTDVRYCFKNFSPATLFDNYGTPAAPFRTDSYDK